MEEIVTIDGHQFKLTVDRPLTAQEKAQVIAQIRAQTGCSTCGPRGGIATPSWNYGGMSSLAVPAGTTAATTTATCPANKQSGSSVTLQATPAGGIGPYTATFYRQVAGTAASLSTASPITEGNTATYTYTITDADVSAAAISGTITIAVPGGGGVGAEFGPLSAGYIRFSNIVTDSCAAGAGGPGWCAQYCDVAIVCIPPTCGFVVS